MAKIIKTNINDQCVEQAENMNANGFETKPIPTILMLIVSELSEAMEADRKDHFACENCDVVKWLYDNMDGEDTETWKKTFEEHVKNTFEDEIADALLRIMDLCGRRAINIDRHIAMKSYYNSLRPVRHGKKY